MSEPIKDCPQPESAYKPVTTVHGATSLSRRRGMNVPNRLRSNATAIRVRAVKLQDSVLKSALLAVADDLDEMRGLVLEHHDDYTKPLDVRWLCTKHHAEHHRRMRETRQRVSEHANPINAG